MKKRFTLSTLNRATPLTDVGSLVAADCPLCSPKTCTPVFCPPEPGERPGHRTG